MQDQLPFLIQTGAGNTLELTPQSAAALDIVAISENQYHILYQGKKYIAELESVDFPNRTYQIKVNGNSFPVHIADKYERLIKSMGLGVGGATKVNAINAPMPGLVLDIMVTEGQTVQKGDPLLILEAMKMENVIKSAGEGVVKAIKVKKGTPVDKGTLLISFV